MNQDARNQRRAEAAAAFNQHEQRSDGDRIAGSLGDALNLLCDLFYTRIQGDVEKAFGQDSMLIPVSLVKSEEKTKREIDLYLLVESAEEVRVHSYASGNDDWYLNWLTRLRLGDISQTPAVQQRFEQYFDKPHQERRRAFSVVLQRTLPESNKAPLIVYRLFPMAISIATAVGFGDHAAALDTRKQQVTLLPGIRDCQHCHGNVLENGERCSECGNPLWKYEWLTAE